MIGGAFIIRGGGAVKLHLPTMSVWPIALLWALCATSAGAIPVSRRGMAARFHPHHSGEGERGSRPAQRGAFQLVLSERESLGARVGDRRRRCRVALGQGDAGEAARHHSIGRDWPAGRTCNHGPGSDSARVQERRGLRRQANLQRTGALCTARRGCGCARMREGNPGGVSRQSGVQ